MTTMDTSLGVKTNMEKTNYEYLNQVLDLALDVGSLLLQNGGEVKRVERCIRKILNGYGIEAGDLSIQLDSIIIAVNNPYFSEGVNITKVRKVPVKGNNLGRVIALNQMAYDIENNKYTLDEAICRMEQIQKSAGFPSWIQIPGAGFMSACFSILSGGDMSDFLAALIVGMIVWSYVLLISSRWLGKYFGHISNGIIVAVGSMVVTNLGLVDNPHSVIIGVFMILTPGLAFIRGFRDFADEYYISGLVRLIDASFIFICMAIGAALTAVVYQQLFGGVVL